MLSSLSVDYLGCDHCHSVTESGMGHRLMRRLHCMRGCGGDAMRFVREFEKE